MKQILAATDLSPRADRAIRRAFRLATAQGAAVDVAYVVDASLPERLAKRLEDDARGVLEQFCRHLDADGGPNWQVRIATGDVSEDLHRMAHEVEADLIVLGTHRPRPFRDILRETTLERLVRLSIRPMLVATDRADHDYRNILAALDFSPGSTRAATLATELFPAAEIRGFHAVHIPFQGLTDPAGHASDAAFYLKEAAAEREAWAERTGMAALAKATEITEGGLHEVLERQFKKRRPDLLTLGAHGRTGKAPFLLGSFANDMMRDTPCDLLIARG